MKNQFLIDWTARLSATYQQRLQDELDTIERIEASAMHTWTNGQDIASETLERAKRTVTAYRDGIEIMARVKLNLEAEE